MNENEILALVKKLEQRILLAKETYPTCGCSNRTIERRKEASAYLNEAAAIAKEVHDEIQIQQGEKLLRVTA